MPAETEPINTRHPEHQYLNLMADILQSDDRRAMYIPGDQGYSCVLGAMHKYDLRAGFPLLTTKDVYWKGVNRELLWFLGAGTNIKPLVDQGVNIWNGDAYKRYQRASRAGRAIDLSEEGYAARIKHDSDFAAEWGDLGPVYGAQWRRWQNPYGGETDQLQQLVDQLRDPIAKYRKSNLVSAWNPSFLPGTFPDDEMKEMALPACHVMFQTDVDEQNRLTVFMYQRSADMFLGVPFNIASYALLTHMLAQVSDLEAYQFIHMMSNAHVYHRHFEAAREQIAREPFPLSKLVLNPDIKEIDNFGPNDFKIEGYRHHPRIKAEMIVVGGRIDNLVQLGNNPL